MLPLFIHKKGPHIGKWGVYMMGINEPLAALRSNIKCPALILTSLTENFEASNLDNILDSINGGFLIIGHLDQIGDFSAEMHVVSKMKQIETDIIARMLYDHQKCEPLALKAIPGFNINSVSYEMLGPVFDNDYGVMFSFKLQDCPDLEYDNTNMLIIFGNFFFEIPINKLGFQ